MRFRWIKLSASNRSGFDNYSLLDTARNDTPVARAYFPAGSDPINIVDSDNFLTALGDNELTNADYTFTIPQPLAVGTNGPVQVHEVQDNIGMLLILGLLAVVVFSD